MDMNAFRAMVRFEYQRKLQLAVQFVEDQGDQGPFAQDHFWFYKYVPEPDNPRPEAAEPLTIDQFFDEDDPFNQFRKIERPNDDDPETESKMFFEYFEQKHASHSCLRESQSESSSEPESGNEPGSEGPDPSSLMNTSLNVPVDPMAPFAYELYVRALLSCSHSGLNGILLIIMRMCCVNSLAKSSGTPLTADQPGSRTSSRKSVQMRSW